MWQLPGPEGLQWCSYETWLSSCMWLLPGLRGCGVFSNATWLSSWMWQLTGPEGLQWFKRYNLAESLDVAASWP